MKNRKIYIVHAVDTEGPLNESLKSTFERIYELFGLRFKNKNRETLNNLRRGLLKNKKINLEKLKKTINPHLLNYNRSWKDINKMLQKINKKDFRNAILDSNGNGWKFSWHCVDHVDYKINPRKRTLGYHKIFDFYSKYIKKNNDKVHFHFHPMSTYKEAHRNAKSYFNSPHLYQVISRRIIDRDWFPTAFRAGFHIERPDINLFLEQFIPFDLSNTSKIEKNKKKDLIGSRGFDWRRATKKWKIYNPHHDDYQIPGHCRRYIGRVLSIRNRVDSIDLKETLKAFKQANSGEKTMLAVTSHDFRDLGTEVEEVRGYLKKAMKKFPKVKIYFVDTAEAFRKVLNFSNKKKLKLKITKLKDNSFKISTIRGKVFGPQPFLAIKFKNGKYMSDNLDFGLDKKTWYYKFSKETVRPKDLQTIAVGASDKFGNYDVRKYTIRKNR